MYSPQTGDVADATWRSQIVAAFAGDYLIDGCAVSVGDSTTSIETTVAPGTVRFGPDVIEVEQQSVTHPDGPAPGGGPNGEDEGRVDLVTIDSNGSAGRMVGTVAAPDPPKRRFPNVRQPVPPTPQPSDDVVVVAAVWVPAGTGSAAEMFADWIIPREVESDALNQLDLIPGRDFQYVLDNAREGATLEGDRSQTIVLDQPLTCTTPNVTIRNIDWRLANGTATSDGDDMLQLAADGITVENATLDGNMGNQTADPDGIVVTASDCSVRDVRATAMGGHVVNLNGGSNAVANTTVRNIRAEQCRKDALVVQGTGAVGSRVQLIKAHGSGQRGTLTIRNGANGVYAQGIFGTDQQRVIEIEDFGPDHDASARVQTVWMDTVIGNGVTQLVDAAMSPELDHRGFRLSHAGGGSFPTTNPSDGIILFNYCDSVRITACPLSSSDIQDTHNIYLGQSQNSRIDHCRLLNDAPDHHAIRLNNPKKLVDVDHNEVRFVPNTAISIRNGAGAVAPTETLSVNHNRFDNISGDAIHIHSTSNGLEIDGVIATGNNGRNIDGAIVNYSSVTGTTEVSGNLG